MNKLQLFKGLAVVALFSASGVASAYSVSLVADQLRTAGGTLYTKFTDGSDGAPASTATWDWDGTTLTQTGGTYYATRRLGSVAVGQILETDQITGLVINTSAGTTTATTYNCIEGTFGAGTGSSICGNINWQTNFVFESTLAYNVGGNADCISKTIGGDDTDGGALRGLTTHAAAGSCTAQLGAYQRYNAALVGTTLTLNNGINGLGNGAIQFTFSTVPVPGAVWLFGSALGLMGLARRRTAVAA